MLKVTRMHKPTAPPLISDAAVERFRIDVPEAILIDLRERSARVRWPDEPPGADQNYGTDLAYLQNLVAYWRDGYAHAERLLGVHLTLLATPREAMPGAAGKGVRGG